MLSAQRDQLLRLVRALPLHEEMMGLLIEKKVQGLSRHAIRLYRVELGYSHNYLQEQGVHTLLDVTPNTIRRWLLQLSQTRNPGSVHVSYRVLKTFFRWCWLEYDIESPNPIAKVKPP